MMSEPIVNYELIPYRAHAVQFHDCDVVNKSWNGHNIYMGEVFHIIDIEDNKLVITDKAWLITPVGGLPRVLTDAEFQRTYRPVSDSYMK